MNNTFAETFARLGALQVYNELRGIPSTVSVSHFQRSQATTAENRPLVGTASEQQQRSLPTVSGLSQLNSQANMVTVNTGRGQGVNDEVSRDNPSTSVASSSVYSSAPQLPTGMNGFPAINLDAILSMGTIGVSNLQASTGTVNTARAQGVNDELSEAFASYNAANPSTSLASSSVHRSAPQLSFGMNVPPPNNLDAILAMGTSGVPIPAPTPPTGGGFPFSNVNRLSQVREANQNSYSLNSYSSRGRGRASGRGAATTSAKPGRPYSRDIIFFGDMQEKRERPHDDRLRELNEAGLGHTTIEFTESDMRDLPYRVKRFFLLQKVPDLRNTKAFNPNDVQFTLYYVKQSGNKTLLRLPLNDVTTLQKMRAMKLHTIYATPSITMLPLKQRNGNDEEGQYTDEMDQDDNNRENAEQETLDILCYRIRTADVVDILIPQICDIRADEIFRFFSEIRPTVRSRCRIEGEDAYDIGGITRGYISAIMRALSTIPIAGDAFVLEGSSTNLTISADSIIMEKNIPTCFANFMLFSVMNTKVGFIGLSSFTTAYILNPDPNDPPVPKIADVPDAEAKYACELLYKLEEGLIEELQDVEVDVVNLVLSRYGSTSSFCKGKEKEAMEYIKHKATLGVRKRALDELRVAFQAHTVGKWISDHPSHHKLLFPTRTEPALDDFMKAFAETEENMAALIMMRQFAENYVNGGKKLTDLLECTTSFPVLPDKMHLRVEPTQDTFTVSTCDHVLNVFPTEDYDTFAFKMYELIANGKFGFTMA